MEFRELTLSGDKAKAFAELMERLGEDKPASIAPEIAIERIKDHYKDYANKHVFKPGDIVRLKPGLGCICEKLDSKPCIVIEMLAQPIMGDSSGPPPEYGATLDMRIGALAQSGVFTMALFESAIFEPWPNEQGG